MSVSQTVANQQGLRTENDVNVVVAYFDGEVCLVKRRGKSSRKSIRIAWVQKEVERPAQAGRKLRNAGRSKNFLDPKHRNACKRDERKQSAWGRVTPGKPLFQTKIADSGCLVGVASIGMMTHIVLPKYGSLRCASDFWQTPSADLDLQPQHSKETKRHKSLVACET